MKRLTLSAALVIGASSVWLWSPAAGGQNGKSAGNPQSAPPLKIAVIDVGQVILQYERSEDIAQKLSSSKESAESKTKQMAKAGRELQKELAQFEPGTPEFIELEQKVEKAVGDFNVFRALSGRELNRRRGEAQLAVYQEITAAVKKSAEQNGYTLVLRIDREALAARSHETLEATLRQEIFGHPQADDITDAVAAYLNQQYEAKGAAKEKAERQSQPAAPTTKTRKPPR